MGQVDLAIRRGVAHARRSTREGNFLTLRMAETRRLAIKPRRDSLAALMGSSR